MGGVGNGGEVLAKGFTRPHGKGVCGHGLAKLRIPFGELKPIIWNSIGVLAVPLAKLRIPFGELKPEEALAIPGEDGLGSQNCEFPSGN